MRMMRNVIMREARPKKNSKGETDFDYIERAMVIDLMAIDAWYVEGFAIIAFVNGYQFTIIQSSLPANFMDYIGQ